MHKNDFFFFFFFVSKMKNKKERKKKKSKEVDATTMFIKKIMQSLLAQNLFWVVYLLGYSVCMCYGFIDFLTQKSVCNIIPNILNDFDRTVSKTDDRKVRILSQLIFLVYEYINILYSYALCASCLTKRSRSIFDMA
jgi:hypothetical protein